MRLVIIGVALLLIGLWLPVYFGHARTNTSEPGRLPLRAIRDRLR